MKYALLIYAAEKDWADKSPEEQKRIYDVSFATTPAEGLELLAGLEATASLQQYAPFHLARADMVRRLGCCDESKECYRRALPCAQNDQVRRFIEQRLNEFAP